MRRIELLVEDVRRETENEEFSDTTGIQDAEFIRFANDAQDRLESKIYQKYQKIFMSEKTIASVAGQIEYDLPFDCYMNNAVSRVRYRHAASGSFFYSIDKSSIRELVRDVSGIPNKYVRLDGQIHLIPSPSSPGSILINYIRRLDRIDKRRALIDTVTTTGSAITTLNLDTTEFIDKTELEKFSSFSVVDKDGNQVMRNVLFTSVDDITGIVAIDPAFAFESGETISSGNYLVAGRDSANASELPESCERYLISYMAWKIFKRDSSEDSQEASLELQMLEQDIVDSFAEIDDDITTVPIEDTTFIDFRR